MKCEPYGTLDLSQTNCKTFMPIECFTSAFSIHILPHNQQTCFYCMNCTHIHLKIPVVKKSTTIKYIDSKPFNVHKNHHKMKTFDIPSH